MKMKRFLALIIAIVLVVSLVGCADTNKASNSDGSYYVYTEHYGFTEGEMTYLYNYVYNQYGAYLSQLGVDTEKSLKDQEYYDGQTWFDYMMDQAVTYAQDFLLFCEEADVRGIKLDETDEANIKTELEALKTAAIEAGFDTSEAFLADQFGEALTLVDYENFIRKSTLASKFYTELVDSYAFTEDDIATYFSSNENMFKFVDFISFSFAVDEANGVTEEIAVANANALKASANQEEFLKQAEAFILAGTTEEVAATLDMEAELAKLTQTTVPYTAENPFSEWAFGAEAAVNTTFMESDAENGIYTVYYLTKLPARDDSRTVNARHILVTTEKYATDEATLAKAEEILAEWKAGAADAESFAALATTYSEDSGSVRTGGLYENIAEGEMVTEFNDWIFDTARKTGDTDIVKTDYGYHIMYFETEGMAAWENQVKTTLKQEAYSKDYEALKATYPITIQEEQLLDIEG